MNSSLNVSKIIETDNLILRKPQFEDWESMYRNVWCHKETSKYMLWSVSTSEKEAQERMKKSIAFQKKERDAYFVYDKKTGQGIGFAGMKEIESGVFEDIGIALGPDYVNKGYGKQILMAMIEEARRYGAKEFICSCRNTNIVSKKLQLSCGFRFDHSEKRIDPRDNSAYQLDFYRLKL